MKKSPLFILLAVLLLTNATHARGASSPTVASDDGSWSQLVTTPSGNSAVYDSRRDRMIVLAGADVLTLALSGQPTWVKLNTSGSAPPASFTVNAGGMNYDPVRDRVLVVTQPEQAGVDVWALSLSGRPTWTKLSPDGTVSTGRTVASIYDPVADRLVLFGVDSVWQLSLSGNLLWTSLSTAGTSPSYRGGFTAVYDSKRHRAIIFGGDGDDYLNPAETWTLSLSGQPTWEKLAPGGAPVPGRVFHSAIYDPLNDQMIIYGGDEIGYYSRNDLWALRLSGNPQWTQLSPRGLAPSVRTLHGAIYDPVRRQMVITGGWAFFKEYEKTCNDAWALSLTSDPAWTALVPVPIWRSGHTSIYDPVRDRMLMFGSRNGPIDGNQMFALVLSGEPTWSLIDTGVPPAMAGARAVYDQSGDRMVMVGIGQSSQLTEAWQLGLSRPSHWVQLNPSGTPPSAPQSAVYDPTRDRMVVLGGTSSVEVWALDLSGTPAWTQLGPSQVTPAPRVGQTCILDPVHDRIVMFGGFHLNGQTSEHFNDVWEFSFGNSAWSNMTPLGQTPPARDGQTAIYDPVRQRMVILGGHTGVESYDDLWALSLVGSPTWVELHPAEPTPNARNGHTAIYDPKRDRMIVFGGVFGYYQEPFNDTWALEWGSASDVTPPRISVDLSRTTLWPPNNKLVMVCATVNVTDDSDPAPTFTLVSIAAMDGKRAVDAANDIQNAAFGTSDLCYALRATRSGAGDGRTYRIIYEARDVSSNVACDTISVRVPANATLRSDVAASRITGITSVHPNPFNPETTVEYSLENSQRVAIAVYDVRGTLVRNLVNEPEAAGLHRVTWNGADDAGRLASSGIYFVRMTAGSRIETRKIVMVK